MPKSKRASRRRTRDAPQFYEPRVEVALLALAEALVGCQMLVKYLTTQQGPDWRDLDNLFDAAESDFSKAQAWQRKCRVRGGKGV